MADVDLSGVLDERLCFVLDRRRVQRLAPIPLVVLFGRACNPAC
jgi:hypothetical protein